MCKGRSDSSIFLSKIHARVMKYMPPDTIITNFSSLEENSLVVCEHGFGTQSISFILMLYLLSV